MVSPLLTALVGVVVERLMLRRIYNRDPVYSLLFTFGAAVFVMLQDYISSMTVNRMSFIGLIFMFVVLFFPRGLLGTRIKAAQG